MTERRVILVTGVAGYWGAKVVARLLELNSKILDLPEDLDTIDFHIIGLDTELPDASLKGLDFIQADIRNPLLVDLLRSEKVDCIAHLGFLETDQYNEDAFDFNVIGTMKVLGAASEAGVKKVVLRSSTTVYGASPTNPAFISEEQPLSENGSGGSIRYWINIEDFINGFRRQVPEMIVSILRFANIIGPSVDSPLTRYLKLNPPPILLGFDPLMQVIHEDDVVKAIEFAILKDIPGVYNISAEDVIPLAKIFGLAGKYPIPVLHFFAYWGRNLKSIFKSNSDRYFPFPLDYIRYSWVADISRMREEIGYIPAYTGEEAIREFAGYLRIRKFKPEKPDLTYDEERLKDTIERRRRHREQIDINQEGLNTE